MTKAFAPGNLSCIFVICPDRNPAKMGSLGVGITVDKGVIVSVRKSKKVVVKVNNKNIDFPTVLDVVKRLAKGDVRVSIKYQLPYGCGFGMSGGAAIATAYALNELFKLGKSKEELAMIAHTAEVENRTGLGDVGGQYNGGVCAKFKKGNPLKGVRLRIRNKFVYYRIFSSLDTKKVITKEQIKKKINKAGIKALGKIKKERNLTFEKLIRISKEFSIKSGLLQDKRVKETIRNIERKGFFGSMVMLGNAVYSDRPFKGCKRLEISSKGAYIVKRMY